MAVSINFRPTLLVGVGGTGCKIAEAILTEAKKNSSSIINRIGILAIDTDENIKPELLHLDNDEFLQISRPETVYRLLERNSEIEDDWCYRRGVAPMVEPILSKSLIEGAGQLRMLTRLALYDSFKNHHLLDKLEKAISKLTVHGDDQGYDGAIHILMVGSLAGATGSGSFAHLALALRQAARNRDALASVRGVFLLPDVYVRAGVLKETQHANVLANGYASLKEINAINVKSMIRQRKADFEFEYLKGRQIIDGSSPFEAMTFIDYENPTGGSMGRNPDAYVRMAARAGYLMIFSPIGAAYGSDVINDVRQGLGAVAAGSSNMFSGIGVAAIKYPKESMETFLSSRLIVENLKGDWIRLDQSYRDRMERFREEKNAGRSGGEEPDKRKTYVKDLSQLARDDSRIPFFKHTYDNLFPEYEDEKTFERAIKPLHEDFVNATVDYVERDFWAEKDMADIRSRLSSMLDSSSLIEGDSLVDTVRRAESELDGSLRSLEAALQTRPENTYENTVVSADNLGPGEWAPHHIQSYIVEKVKHPVGVRAFLYLVEEELANRRDAIDLRDSKLKLFRLANEFRDDDEIESTNNRPESRSTPRVIEEATNAGEGGGLLNKVMGRKKKAFAEDYVDYYNRSAEGIRRYASALLQAKVYDQAIREVNALIRAFEGLFVEIEGIIEALNKTIETEQKRYSSISSFDGNAFVYANEHCKEQAWQALLSKATGLGLEDAVNKELVTSVYAKHRSDKRSRVKSSFKEIGDLFRKKVVTEFGVETIRNDYASIYDFSVIRAAEKEFEVEDEQAEAAAREMERSSAMPEDRQARLKRLVERASDQSEPYISLAHSDSDGAEMKFWAVHPDSEADIGDENLFSTLFRSSDGSRPIVEDDYSKYELTCVNLRVNLELQHMAKLGLGDERAESVHSQTEGRYTRAYNELVADMLEAERSSSKSAIFTPHVDRTWHVPGVLPEIFPDRDNRIAGDNAKAFVVAVMGGLMRLEDDEGDRVARFTSVGQGLPSSENQILVTSHDFWRIYQAFTERQALVRNAMDFLAKSDHKATDMGGEHPLYKKMMEPDSLLNVLKMSAARNKEVEVRDDAVRDGLTSWIELMRSIIDIQEEALTPKGRRNKLIETVDDIRSRTLALAQDEGYERAQLSVFEDLFGMAYDKAIAG